MREDYIFQIRMRKHITLTGGYFTPKAALEPAADALGRVEGMGDVQIFTFLETMEKPHMVASSMRNGIAVADSAGSVALGRVLDRGGKPAKIVSCDGPEPQTFWHLTKGLLAIRRNCLAIAEKADHPHAETYGRLLEQGVDELKRHPFEYLGHLTAVSRFSTSQMLKGSVRVGIQAAALVSPQDELYPQNKEVDYGSVPLYVHDGGHATFLAEPQRVLQPWINSLQ
jgi:hypothetical protein